MEIKISPSKLKNTISANGKVGLILLATDQITLYEFDAMFKDTNVLCFPSRVMMEGVEITPPVLLGIKDELLHATNTLLPGIDLDVVALSCTSASMAIGENEVARIIKQSNPKRLIKEVTNPYSAIKKVCQHLKIEEIGLITPYSKEITQGIIDNMKDDVKVVRANIFNIPDDSIVPDITPDSIKEAVFTMAKDDNLETIFISCTNLNICRYIDELESITKKRILTSNQVLAWDILRLANYKKPVLGFGKLLEQERYF